MVRPMGCATRRSGTSTPTACYLEAWSALSNLHRGRWARAGELATAVIAGPARQTIGGIMALLALGRLRARRGDPDAWEALDEAAAMAERTATLQRVGPVRAARAEAAWLDGDLDRAGAEARAAFDLARAQVPPMAHRRAGLVAGARPARSPRRTPPARPSLGGSSSRVTGARPPRHGGRSIARTRRRARSSTRTSTADRRGGPRRLRSSGRTSRRRAGCPPPPRARRAAHPARPPRDDPRESAGPHSPRAGGARPCRGGLQNQRSRPGCSSRHGRSTTMCPRRSASSAVTRRTDAPRLPPRPGSISRPGRHAAAD